MNTWKITNKFGQSFWKALSIQEVNDYIRKGYKAVICR